MYSYLYLLSQKQQYKCANTHNNVTIKLIASLNENNNEKTRVAIIWGKNV